MASELLGRATCPECGFQHAHIKIKTDKDKARPYRHCPECGAQYFPRNDTQDANMRKQLEPAKLDAPLDTQGKPTPAPAAPAKPQAYRVVFGVKVPIDD